MTSIDSTSSDFGGSERLNTIKTAIGPQDPRTGRMAMQVGKYLEIHLLEIPKDGQQGGKLKLVKIANALLYQAHKMQLPIAGVAGVLGSLVEERGLFLDSTSEFLRLYGRFEQMLGFADGYNQKDIEREMQARLGDDLTQHSREYVRSGRKSRTPLPLYVRNVLAHQGTNPANGLGDGDLETAIRLLKDWLRPK